MTEPAWIIGGFGLLFTAVAYLTIRQSIHDRATAITNERLDSIQKTLDKMDEKFNMFMKSEIDTLKELVNSIRKDE